MAEEKKKVEKKATTKASATKKKTTAKAETKAKVEEKPQPTLTTDFSNISPELMQQMFAAFQAMQEQNAISAEPAKKEKVVEEKPKKVTKAYLRTIKDREVVVRSVYGPVSFTSSKTHITYKWNEIGDEEVMTVEEILAMNSRSTRFLKTPWLVVDDEEVAEGLELTKLYDTIKKIEDIDELLELSVGEIKDIIRQAPYEYKKNLAGVIFDKVNKDEIRDRLLIRELEDVLGTTLLF